ncbi:MAG: NYN domain-containing protein [Actinomycetota bacterium]|nr:NYN domain-containing protein [Actinomycetota bacterium]
MPREAVPVLVKALGAYLRASQPNDLPAAVRRLREFRPRALEQHAEAVLALLDDDVQKSLIEQWLQKVKPSLKRAEVEALRIAMTRGDGWVADLKAVTTAPKTKAPAPATAQSDDADRDRARADKARRDLAKVRGERDEARARQRATANELSAAQAEIARLSKMLEEANAREASAVESLAKERRKAERDVGKARRQAEDARRDFKDARRELAALARELGRTKEEPRPARVQPKKADVQPTGPRKPLRAPRGRLEDDPETLSAWLEAPGALLLVDGYNVALTKSGGGDLSDRRRRLVGDLATLMRMKKASAVVIFDGSDVARGTFRRSRGPVAVEYSRADEIADDHLIAKLERLPPNPVIVVTNDRELQQRAAALGATIATSDQLLALIR